MLQRLARHLAWEHGRAEGAYRRLCKPDGYEWAEYLKHRDTFYSQGENVWIVPTCHLRNTGNPKYMRLGNNVHVTDSVWLTADGAVNMVASALGIKLDRVGKIDVRDNCFIGHDAILMPGVTIGPYAVVGAGAVVTKDVPPKTIVAGVPARPVGTWDDYVEKLKKYTDEVPWGDIIQRREGGFDPELEPLLEQLRTKHWFVRGETEGSGG